MEFATGFRNLAVLLTLTIVLIACGGSGGSGDDRGNCDSPTSIGIGELIADVGIAEGETHCYRFDVVDGNLYRITLDSRSGDADLALHMDSRYDLNSVIDFSINPGTVTDEINYLADESATRFLEVYGYLSTRYNLIVSEDPFAGGTTPVASIAPVAVAVVQTGVVLDGSASFDPNGDPLTFRWSLVDSPAGSSAVLLDEDQAVATLIPDLVGDYRVRLIVNDGTEDSAAQDLVISVAGNTPPVAVAPAWLAAAIGQPTLLDGGASNDADGQDLTYRWRLLDKPAASSLVFADQFDATVGFDADVFGDYRFELVVNDGIDDSAPVIVVASATHSIEGLGFRVTDAEYSDALNLIVMVSADSSALVTYEPATNITTSIALPFAPSSVSVSPDGLYAAVGHNGWISYVDLDARSLVKTLGVTADVLDIVLDGRGYAHAFPRGSQWERIRSVEIATGIETLHTGNSVYAGTHARLHPGGDAIYGADNGLSPSDIEKYDISVSPLQYLTDSPYHGDFPMCGDLWFSEDGKRIFTRCARVFKSSPLQAEDMIYNGVLENATGRIVALDQDTQAKQVAVVFQDGSIINPDDTIDTAIHFYEDSYLTEQAEVHLPALTSVDSAYAAHARFVFFNDDGTQYYAIVQADAGSGLLNDFAILIPPGTGDPGGSNRAPVADAGPNQAALVGAGVSFDGGASSDADGDSLNFSWQILAAPAGSAAALVGAAASSAEFTPDLAGSYEIGLVVDDGDLSSTRDPVRLTAVNVGDSFLLQLRYPVTDAEYSDTLERIVSVSAVESRLYIFDTVDYHQTWLDLPLVPTSVSVSPDGLYAAVGHNGWISYVDLLANKLVDTISVSTDVFDIVLDGRGYAHAFPRINQWERIRSVEIATGIETLHTGNSVYAGTRARLHPGGDAIYGADNGLSPSDIEKYDVSVSPLQYLTDSPYHGDYAMCGDLWISEDGLRIFTRCGNVFRASSDPGLDMTYNGSMTSGAERLLSVTSSAEAGLIAAIIEDGSYSAPDPTADTRVHFYDHSFLVDDGNPVTLNAFAHHGNTYDAHGRWVFFNSDGSHFFGIVQADPSSGLVEDFGISVH